MVCEQVQGDRPELRLVGTCELAKEQLSVVAGEQFAPNAN